MFEFVARQGLWLGKDFIPDADLADIVEKARQIYVVLLRFLQAELAPELDGSWRATRSLWP